MTTLAGILAGVFALVPVSGRAVPSPASPQVSTEERRIDLEHAVGGEILFPLAVRSDRSLVAAELTLDVSPTCEADPCELEIALNGEPVAQVGAEALAAAEVLRFALEPVLSGDRNVVALRIRGPAQTCGASGGSAWSFLRAAFVTLENRALPLPDDLGLWPLPFVDRDYDTAARIPMVFWGDPTPARVRAASLIAGWFGVEVGVPLSFSVYVRELPERAAVVFLDHRGAAEELGLEWLEGPAVRMVDHPRLPGSNAKLLVVSGNGSEELASAALALSARQRPLAGPLMRLKPREPEPFVPYAAPRWIDASAPVRVGAIPEVGPLRVSGRSDGSIPIRFRMPPDVWTWPDEVVALDLGWFQTVPAGPAPRLDVELNGLFVATLPPLEVGVGEVAHRKRLFLRRDHLRGFNELKVHVRGLGARPADDRVPESYVGISPDSVLHLEGARHYAELPDVGLFVHDGFPFTRLADLSESVLVLPDEPGPPELASALSLLAHFASVTGSPGTGLDVMGAGSLLREGPPDKDLLLVGVAPDHAVLQRWAGRFPARVVEGGLRAQRPEQTSLLSWLDGGRSRRELGRAEPLLSRLQRCSTVLVAEVPGRPGRGVVAVTATSLEDLPQHAELEGYARRQQPGGDLLVAAGDERWAFSIGPVFGRGELGAWTALRRFVALRWLLLFPAAALGALLLAFPMRRYMRRRMRERLEVGA